MESRPRDSFAPTPVPPSERVRIFLYLGFLTVVLALGDPNGGLISVPLSFFLKNKMHLDAQQLAGFRLISAIPLYLSFVFGFIRDTWSPFGARDRGYVMIFGTVSACLYVLFAFIPWSYRTLLVAVPLLTSSSLFVSSAQSGLASTLGRQHAMSGQISAVWNTFGSLPAVASLLIGGRLSDAMEQENSDQAAHLLFLTGAALLASLAWYGVWKPKFVFGNLADEGSASSPLDDFGRLIRHRAIYPALAIWLLWNFAPGSSTPLQYYLQNTLHAQDSQWGEWNAIFAASFIPAFIAYGFLCRRYPLRILLRWGTIIAIPQFVPLLFVHSADEALIAAAPIGLMGGVATSAYLDLIIRSCPRGLEATTLMMSGALYYLASRAGDVLGTDIYERYGGFSVCVTMITIAYALILPTLLSVPGNLTDYADGEASHAPSAS